MEIKYFYELTEEQIEDIAKKHYSHWVNYNSAMVLKNTIKKFKNVYKSKTLPFGIALFDNNALIGFCVLKLINLKNYHELKPWISDVMILKEFRGMGYGRKLIEQAEQILKGFGYSKIYIWTDQAPNFYKKLGYKYEMQVEKNEGGFGKLFSKKDLKKVMKKIEYLRTGGQSGVDRATLDYAKENKINICGWCPKGGWAEDLTTAPGVLEIYPMLKETPSSDVSVRTSWNVRDSHATLIIQPENYNKSNGTNLTISEAIRFKRPYFVISSIDRVNDLVTWIKTLGDGLTLNVAGPRASEWAEGYETAQNILKKLFSILS